MKILITGGNGNIAQMIKRNLSSIYEITNPSRADLNLLNFNELKLHLNNNKYDILIHTAITGGRRTKEENGDVTHANLLMLENILYFSDNFKMILNFDSAAIYDRSTNIFNRSEEELLTIPEDYYGFSKYCIYQRSIQYTHFYNLRIFNIFHINEEKDRFIKSCFISKKNNTKLKIFENKYFDFVYEDDFITILKYYLDNYLFSEKLEKTINICYDKKYMLSDIANIILNDNVTILNNDLKNNYSGNSKKLDNLKLDLIGLEKSLLLYEKNMNITF